MGTGPVRDDEGTAARILDAAERLVQERGFNGFSYADIAGELGITKAALHYHFAGKADLGLALIARYASRFAEALAAIDAAGAVAPGPALRLAEYAALYLRVIQDGRMCLCGMLAAEYLTLPPPMREAVAAFFDENEAWLEKVLAEGRADGSLRLPGTAREAARMVIAALEGAMLTARPYADAERFRAVAASVLAGLAPEAGDKRTPA
jgi:TetR/AcrR family transcriptional regulator, transcriptional repressor for nem operon